MIVNLDKETKSNFKNTLEKLELKEREEITFVLSADAYVLDIGTPIEIHQDSLSVDSEGKALISNRDIDRIAQRVVDLLKKKRVV